MSTFFLVILSILAFGCFVAAIVLASFGFFALFGSPFVGTNRRLVHVLLERSGVASGDVFVDIGSGTGTFLIEAVRSFEAKRAVGYEINPILVFFSRIRVRFLGLHDQIEIKQSNIFHDALIPCDVIAVYLLPSMMARLEEKLLKECKNVRCISRGFVFPHVQPVQSWVDSFGHAYLYYFKS